MLGFKEALYDFIKLFACVLLFSLITWFFANVSTLCLEMHRYVTYKESVGLTIPILYIGYILSVFNRMK